MNMDENKYYVLFFQVTPMSIQNSETIQMLIQIQIIDSTLNQMIMRVNGKQTQQPQTSRLKRQQVLTLAMKLDLSI